MHESQHESPQRQLKRGGRGGENHFGCTAEALPDKMTPNGSAAMPKQTPRRLLRSLCGGISGSAITRGCGSAVALRSGRRTWRRRCSRISPRKAEKLAGRPALAGWLHTSTRLAAAQAAALVTRMWAAAQGWKDGILTADFADSADKGGCGGRGWGETETNGGSPQKTPKGAKMDELFFCRQHVARGKGDDGEVGIFNHGWTRMNTDFRSGGERVVGEAPGIHAA